MPIDIDHPVTLANPIYERYIQIGMRAVIADLQDYVDNNAPYGEDLDAPSLSAYLLACLITAGGPIGEKWPAGHDGQS